jgi:hypothetical protein
VPLRRCDVAFNVCQVVGGGGGGGLQEASRQASPGYVFLKNSLVVALRWILFTIKASDEKGLDI